LGQAVTRNTLKLGLQRYTRQDWRKSWRQFLGISREGVINLLGKADWAVIPGDKGEFAIPDPSIKLVLYWKNPGWNPVAVQFDNAIKVTGWDEGRAYQGKDANLLEPPKEYSCEKPDRKNYSK
jgi:hypothetical protein